ncbi:MAG TPA: hypothetical protein VMC84_04065 [Methanocella sp.]|uniref:hypothetical protein n=1 Tax=Methanocella sp. TaxID=2052833 RepID=UPI002C682C72|nr:hypothetical protein [Methanocella sp.]HTY90330.1 hypothetical protein [Methanocella sp.]
MGVKDGMSKVLSKLWEIAVITVLLAAGVGIGSLLTQYVQKTPLDYTLTAQLMVIFGAIIALGGIIFSMMSRRVPG